LAAAGAGGSVPAMRHGLRWRGWLGGAAVLVCQVAWGAVWAQDTRPGEVVRVDRTSPFGRVRVSDYGATGLRCLEFPPGRVLQSCMRIDDPTRLVLPYTQAFAATLAVPGEVKRLLMIGLGGGSLVRWLQRYRPELAQHVVDIDPVVVEVAGEWFGVRAGPGLQIITMDGRERLARDPARYDLIWLDAFGPEDAPYALTTVEFFQLVRSRLAPGGAVAANIWAPGVNRSYHAQVRAVQEAFPETYELSEPAPDEPAVGLGGGLAVLADGSRIVVGSLAPRLAGAQWAERLATWQAKQPLDCDLAALVRRKFHLLTDRPSSTSPPHDLPAR